ncbi:Sulfate adenylyltransferase subunit 1 [hydrothermal vent metagenome]|uniref:sulfate adenylyltransferase n=1 Tax=hydrothermal vent metagenome TaxID=652676 RepID=A0A3B0W715_9ZZZZ
MSHQSDLIAQDIEQYLEAHKNKDLLRFITCGSVDDGKSTLIGRLLYDSKMIYEDQLQSIEKDSKKVGTQGDEIDLALLVDGLQSEREQGITIDVAYRFFSTEKRKFIIADTPGHTQYTRNMATGASTADLAIILIDARYGVQEQTKRHSFIVSLLGIKNILIAVNKMDLVEFSESRYQEIQSDYLAFAKDLGITNPIFVPLSALNGDNVVNHSEHTPWYTGGSLMNIIETIDITPKEIKQAFRFPVQYVNRPHLNFRGFAGTIASGSIQVGDQITVLPSLKTTKIASIVEPSVKKDSTIQSAFATMAVTFTTEDEIDISRGDLLVKTEEQAPDITDSIQATLVWMHESAAQLGKEYLIKHTSHKVKGQISSIEHIIDVNTLEKKAGDTLQLNDIALCNLTLNRAIPVDSYDINKITGSFIIIDRYTHATVGAGMITQANQSNQNGITPVQRDYSEFEKDLNALVLKHFPEWGAKSIDEIFKG